MRASAMHAWYGRPGLLMASFVLLTAVATQIAETVSWAAYRNPLLLMPAVVVLAWLVCRGWQISRMLLLILSWSGVIGATLNTALWWDPQVFAVLVIEIVALALLLSPAVYFRTRNARRIVGKPDAAPVRLLGKRWRLAVLGAPVLGLGITFAWLTQPTHRLGVIGQVPHLRGSLDRGFPMAVDRSQHGPLIASWGSFGRDYVQWTLASLVLFAVLWLWFQERPRLPAAPTQITGSGVNPSGLASRF